MKPIDINPSDEWKNTKGAGDAIQDEQNCWSMWAKCELAQAKFIEKLEEVHTAYEEMAKRFQLMEQNKLIKG